MPPTAQSSSDVDARLEQLLSDIDPSWAEVTQDILYHRGKKALHAATAFAHDEGTPGTALLEHLVETAELSLAIAQLEPYRARVGRDVLVAIGLTHDIGKIDSYGSRKSRFGRGRSDTEMNSAAAGLLILGETRAAHEPRWRELGRYDDADQLARNLALQYASQGPKGDRATQTLESAIVTQVDRALTGVNSFVSGQTIDRETGGDGQGTLLEFWKHLESRVSGYHDLADQALKFYVGAISALSVWLATAQRTGPLFSLFPFVVGVAGAGHLAYLYLRGWRLQKHARHLADHIRVMAGLSDDQWPYSAAFRPKNIFAYGHPITEPAFSLFIVLALSGLYTYVLLSLP